jgi:hypothetical protein
MSHPDQNGQDRSDRVGGVQRDQVLGDPDDVVGAKPGKQPVPLGKASPSLLVVEAQHASSVAAGSDSRPPMTSVGGTSLC